MSILYSEIAVYRLALGLYTLFMYQNYVMQNHDLLLGTSNKKYVLKVRDLPILVLMGIMGQ